MRAAVGIARPVATAGWGRSQVQRLSLGLKADGTDLGTAVHLWLLSPPWGWRPVVRILATGKTGERQIWHFLPEWVRHFALADMRQLPVTTDLGRVTLQRAVAGGGAVPPLQGGLQPP